MDLCESAPAKSSFDRIMVSNEAACSMRMMNDDSNDLQIRLNALRMDEPEPKSRGIAMEEESKAASLPTPAPAKAAPPKQAVPIPSGKPSFDLVISLQHNTGYWGADKAAYFAGCFRDGQTEDAAVRQALDALTDSLAADADKETLYVTLLAIHVLTEIFAANEDQWVLLVRKAKTYLKNAGIAKPEKLINQFNLQIA